jgi:hypothetical protein
MIREDRDPGFWQAVADHPAVKPHVGLGADLDCSEIVSNRAVTPLASAHGGYLFYRLDVLGRIQELHAMFTPEGWGREALSTLKEAVTEMFARGADLIAVHEVEGNWRSRPPRSFGFRPCAEFAEAAGYGERMRTWSMSRSAWLASPAHRRS